MPLFFVISGILFKSGGTLSDFWRRNLHLIYCYFLWSFTHILLQVYFHSYVNTPLKLYDVITLPIMPVDQFWFLYVYVICQLIATLSAYNRSTLVGVAFFLFLLSDHAPGFIRVALLYFPLIVLGVLCSGMIVQWRSSLLYTIFLGVVFLTTLGLSNAETGCFYPCYSILPSCLLGIGITLSVSKLFDYSSNNFVVRLGRASLTIFAIHVIMAAGTRILVMQLFPETPVLVHILLGTTVGLVGPLLIHEWLEERNLLPYFGFSRFS
jgi:fucose 4-O-acetylase-like acetyltransferase